MSTADMKPFWMVYGVDQGAPTYQHDTAHSAKTEAELLARQNPGKVFVVLEAIAAIRKRDLDVTLIGRGRHVDLEDDIPF